MKIWYVLLLIPIILLAGCGDVEWFPENQSGTTPTTNQQPTTTSVRDSTGTVTASNLVVAELERGITIVTFSLKVDAISTGTQGDIIIEVAAKNAQGLELASTLLTGTLTGGTQSLTKTFPVDINISPNITKWEIKKVTKL